jgi:hypothetical protein
MITAMDGKAPGSDGEIVKLRRLWQEPGGGAWLVTFDLARVEGRLECVGFSVRSYVAHLELDEDSQARESLLGAPLTKEELWQETTALLEFDRKRKSGRPSFERYWWDRLIDGQAQALDAFAAGELVPRPLTAVTLRKLRFYDEVQRARRERSEDYWREAKVSQEQPDWPWGSREALASWAVDFERPRRKAGERRRGRPPKYTLEDLVHVAKIYNAAVDSGSLSPTRDVSDETGWSLNTIDKLVRRCRRLDPPLIAPVKRPHREDRS